MPFTIKAFWLLKFIISLHFELWIWKGYLVVELKMDNCSWNSYLVFDCYDLFFNTLNGKISWNSERWVFVYNYPSVWYIYWCLCIQIWGNFSVSIQTVFIRIWVDLLISRSYFPQTSIIANVFGGCYTFTIKWPDFEEFWKLGNLNNK